MTLKDVAKKAGVSTATVSYALRGGEHVSEATRRKVMSAADQLGYSTNLQARSLKSGRTGIIEIGVHELDMPYFYSKMAAVMARVIENHGYQALVMETGLDGKHVTEALRKISNQMCDGLILHAGGVSASEIKLLSRNRPTVLFDECAKQDFFDTVVASNEQGASLAVRHLLDCGCRSIGLVGFTFQQSGRLENAQDTATLRLRGIRRELSDAGMRMTRQQCIPSGWTVEPGRGVAKQIVERGMPFDGVICVNDGLALGLIRGFADLGIRVPEAVKVIGFDGISVDEYAVPSITSVELDMHSLAEKAVKMVMDRIQGSYDGPARMEQVAYSLAVRESTIGRRG